MPTHSTASVPAELLNDAVNNLVRLQNLLSTSGTELAMHDVREIAAGLPSAVAACADIATLNATIAEGRFRKTHLFTRYRRGVRSAIEDYALRTETAVLLMDRAGESLRQAHSITATTTEI